MTDTVVTLTRDAVEDLAALDGSEQKIVGKALIKLKTEPEKRGLPLGSRADSDLTGYRKLVVGDKAYRIVYRVERDGSVCVVWVIGRRSDDEVYEVAKARLQDAPDQEIAPQLEAALEAAKEL